MASKLDAPDLDVLLSQVNDERTFVSFLDALAKDFALEQNLEAENPSPFGRGQLGWENGTVGAFLDAAAAWGACQTIAGAPPPRANPWQRCAHIIYAGKFYE